MSLKAIVQTLGGDLYEGGQRANIPAPGHSRADRSVSLLLRDGRLIVHTFGDGDWRAVLDHLRAHGLIDNAHRVAALSASGASPVLSRPSDQQRQLIALELWNAGRGVAGTLAERHCRSRGVARALPGGDVLRYGAETPVSVYGPCRAMRPALLAAIRDADGALTAVEITYLASDGRRAPDLRLSRKMVGSVPPGAAARLDAAAPEMLVAEGVFTTLSASEHFGLPAWALMSTGNLRAWSAPEAVGSVLIAADRGQDGEASAQVLLGRLTGQGVRARIALPPEPHGDWNEAAVGFSRAGPPGIGKGRSEDG